MGKSVNEQGLCQYTGFWWALARPRVILPLHLAVVAWGCAWSGGGFGTVLAGLAAGFLFWTLFEYAFHRWLLHHTRRPLLRRIFWNGLHREHHAYRQMEDPEHRGIHPSISLPVTATVVAVAGVSGAAGWAPAVAAGWVLGYCGYEALHWLFHSGAPDRGIRRLHPFRGLLEAHTVHHLHAASRNYGFMTMFWDRLLGTYRSFDDVPGPA